MHFYSKHFFLTYPQTQISNDDFVQFYATSFTNVQLASFTVANEVHQDGSPHLHVLLSYESKIQSSNVAFFDIVDYTGEIRHPNIQISKAPHPKWLQNHIEYAKKTGNFISTHPPYSAPGQKWHDIAAFAKTAPGTSSFMQRVLDLDPRSAILYYHNIARSYESIAPNPKMPSLYPQSSFQEPIELREWWINNLEVSNKFI